MRALAIKQPWAWLIIHGDKDIENRTWHTRYRGRFWVHASKQIDKKAYNELLSQGVYMPNMSDLILGSIIGSVELIETTLISNSDWFQGPIGFKLDFSQEINPIPCKGSLNFFDPYNHNRMTKEDIFMLKCQEKE